MLYMDRRDFLKSLGAGALATAAMAAGCKNPNATSAEGFTLGEVPTDKMTYRQGTHGEKVSLLGYGCMRLPSLEDGKDGNQVDPMEAFQRRFVDSGMIEFLLEQRAKGVIRNLGFSYHGDVKVFDHALSMHDKVHWDHVLIQHNYINWQHASDLAEEAGGGDANSEYLYGELAKRDIPVFVMEPLLGGQLASLPDFAVEELKKHEPQQSVASWAFRFAGNQPRILTVLSGMTYMEHLQDNLRTMSPHKPLTEAEEAMLKSIADRYVEYPLVPCTGCQYCMPCPYGIDIPGNFAHYNKMVNEGHILAHPDDDAGDAERRAYRKARREYLKSYNHAVEPDRQADHCIGCGRCLHECPQRINIPAKLAMIENLL